MRIEVSKWAKNWKSEMDLPRVSLVMHSTIKVPSKNQLNISRKIFRYVRHPEIIAAKETTTRTLILHISHWGRMSPATKVFAFCKSSSANNMMLCVSQNKEEPVVLWTCFQRSMILRMPVVRERSILNAVKELVIKHQADMLYLATHLGPISIWFLKKDRRISSFGSARTDSLGDNLEDILEKLTKTILHSLDDVDCEHG